MIPFLATMWEGIIKSKVGKNEKKFKEKCKDLVDENGYDEVFSDFFNNLIFGQCYSVNDVVDGIPNRNGVAHSWYIKYPSQKAALNAILLTDFVLSLKPKMKRRTSKKNSGYLLRIHFCRCHCLFNRVSTSIRTLCDTGCPSLVECDIYEPCDSPSASDTAADCWISCT